MAFGRRQHNLTVLADGTRPRDRRQLLRRRRSSTSTTASTPPSCGIRRPGSGRRWPPSRSPASTTRPRCCCPTGACCPPAAASAAPATRSATWPRTRRSSRRRTCSRPTARASSRRARRSTPAPAAASYGPPFQIDTPTPASIGKVALVRLGAVTHSVNMEQRYVPLTFTAGAGALTATAPANANIAPPGVYMLFVVDANGVPSVAAWSRHERQHRRRRHAHAAGERRDFTAPATVDRRGERVRRRRHASRRSSSSTARRSSARTRPRRTRFTWGGVPAGSYAITARATDNLGAQTTSAARTVTVAANSAPSVSLTAPVSGASYIAPATISIAANASDADDGVAMVEFFMARRSSARTRARRTRSTGPACRPEPTRSPRGRPTTSARRRPASPGRSRHGDQRRADRLHHVTCRGTSFRWNDQVTINATASDPDGSIARVEFYRSDRPRSWAPTRARRTRTGGRTPAGRSTCCGRRPTTTAAHDHQRRCRITVRAR